MPSYCGFFSRTGQQVYVGFNPSCTQSGELTCWNQLDALDSERHFSLQIPRLALTTPVLLNAILAVSSLHRSRLNGTSPLGAEQYHEDCVRHLIPMLGDSNPTVGGVLLATTAILRVYEQMSGRCLPLSSLLMLTSR